MVAIIVAELNFVEKVEVTADGSGLWSYFKNAFSKTAPACEAALTRKHKDTLFFSTSVPLWSLL